MTTDTIRATPEVDDVVQGPGYRGIVRAVHPDGHVKVASHGDHDPGVWVPESELTVVYREGATAKLRPKNARPGHKRDPRHARPGRVQTIQADSDVMAEALRLAAGDARRLQVNKDGSVYVR